MKINPSTCWTSVIAVTVAALVMGGVVRVHEATAQVPNQPASSQDSADESNQSQQYQSPQDRARTTDQRTHDKKARRASEVIGMDVRPKSGDKSVGEIEDIMISSDGKVEYMAVSFGGFLGIGDKLFAVPPKAVQFEKPSEDNAGETGHARIDVTEQTLRHKEGFDRNKWPEQADQSFLRRTQRQAERPTPSLETPSQSQ